MSKNREGSVHYTDFQAQEVKVLMEKLSNDLAAILGDPTVENMNLWINAVAAIQVALMRTLGAKRFELKTDISHLIIEVKK